MARTNLPIGPGVEGRQQHRSERRGRAMKRYWDHTEAERAALTGEQVEKLLAYELMEQGVLQVEPLKLEEESEVALPTRRVFMLREGDGSYGTLLNLGFATIEQAEACRDAIQFIREQQGWQGPHFTRPVKALQVVSEDLPTADAVTAARVPLEERSRREQANAAARRTFEEDSKKVANATASVWSDWHEQREAEARRQKIRDTLASYREMTEGNEAMARAFLAKAFPDDDIEAAVGALPAEAD
jgi:hypothetical protein